MWGRKTERIKQLEHVLRAREGRIAQLERERDNEIIDLTRWVPADRYRELGNAASDMQLERDAARRERDTLRHAYEELERRIQPTEDMSEERKDRLLVILQQDLEKAINMLLRYAYALGIQKGGLLYDQVQDLAAKYKMGPYIPPANYSYDELTKPDLSARLTMGTRPPEIEHGDNDLG